VAKGNCRVMQVLVQGRGFEAVLQGIHSVWGDWCCAGCCSGIASGFSAGGSTIGRAHYDAHSHWGARYGFGCCRLLTEWWRVGLLGAGDSNVLRS